MNVKYIEQKWSSDPPDFFSREIVVKLADSIQSDGSVLKEDIKETEIRAIRNLDGISGGVKRVIQEKISGNTLYSIIKNEFDFVGQKVRFKEECLNQDSCDFIRSFSINIFNKEDSIRVSIETAVSNQRELENLISLLRLDRENSPPLVDDVLLKIFVPSLQNSGEFNEKSIMISEALVKCIASLGVSGLRTATIGVVIDENSSLQLINDLFSKILAVCMEDDRWKEDNDLNGVIFGNFYTVFMPTSTKPSVNEMILSSIDSLMNSGFESENIRAVNPLFASMDD